VAKVEPKPLTETIDADAVLFPIRQAAITSKISAPISKLFVQSGDRVHEGQLLATLENADIAAAVTENRGGFEQAEAAHVTATQAGIPEETQKAQLDAQQGKENLDAQTKLIESRRMLFEQGALPRKDLDAAQVSYVQAKAQFEIADKHLASLNATGRGASINSANGIGASPPSRTDLRKAVTQAFAPLSCRHRFMRWNRGHPNARSLRKLSSCRMRP